MSLWRDIIVGVDRTIAEFRSAINPTVGLDRNHLWFMQDDEDHWDSEIKYQCPQECERSLGGSPALRTERLENTGDSTLGEMARELSINRYNRIFPSVTTAMNGASTLS